MSPFSVILVPLDGSTMALRSLGCTTWLASQLGARVHILNVGEPLPEGEALERLGVTETYRSSFELHQVQGEASKEILAAVERYGIDLIAITARGEGAGTGSPDVLKVVGHVTREVIEDTHVPVLLLPPAYEESLPWRSVLVPISGEAATDESLTLALRLAHALDLAVTIAHVADSARAGGGGEARTGHYDEPHHEYAQMLNEFVMRACTLCSAEERRRITFIRDLRREHFTERIDTSLGRTEAAIKVLQANLAPPDAILVGPRQLRAATESFATRARGEMIWFHVCLLMFKPQSLFDTLLRPAIENPLVTSIEFILDATQQELWRQEVRPKVDACSGKAKVREPHWTTIRENVSLILSDTGPAGSTECLMSFWGEPFMAYHPGREVPRYIFHIQSHSEIVPRLLELARNYRRAT